MAELLLERALLLEEQPVEPPPVDLLEVRAGKAEQLAEHPERQRPGERLDDVRVPSRRELVDQLGGDRLDARRELVDPPRRERARDQAADPVVQRRVELDDVRHPGAPVGQHGEHLGGQRRGRRLERAGRRERPVVLEHGEDVVVACHDPQVQRGRIEDRLLAPREREDVEGVLPLLGCRRVEVDRCLGGHAVSQHVPTPGRATRCQNPLMAERHHVRIEYCVP
jgi:hypothetical protein